MRKHVISLILGFLLATTLDFVILSFTFLGGVGAGLVLAYLHP